ncbi:MAG TPA: cobyric acid synthase [Symbiobacteriaceae bacterium]|nr:cobyric acid synthase [Symbiobacteriaceae bacterium]
MTARTLMIQGTASNVGKSLLVTALCRIFRQDGWRVAPFKSQNMSNNSYITPDGLEIGRAQGVQAEAAGIPATADMNPVLLKPSSEGESQVIIHGRPYGTMDFRAYRREGHDVAATAIRSSLERMRSAYEVVVIEGAGSPAEVNLRDRELVNMRIAEWADAPVLLVADIDRGGALASLVGTLALLEPHERDRVAGLIINKFRGDRSLLQPAIDFLEQHTGKPVLGVLPYLDVDLEAEDSVVLDEAAKIGSSEGGEGLRICVPRLPRISNFTDLDPLRRAPGVLVEWAETPAQLRAADAVIIPGSKNSAADLRWLWQTGLGAAIQRLAARGVPVVGICGGYQMLGNRLLDPAGHESSQRETPGLELLDVETEFAPAAEKVTERSSATLVYGQGPFAGRRGSLVAGYEIHMGRTRLGPAARLLLRASGGAAGSQTGQSSEDESALGASDAEGQIWGTYLHDIFHNDQLRRTWLGWLWQRRGLPAPPDDGGGTDLQRDAALDRVAAGVRAALALDRIYDLLRLEVPR